MADVLSSIPGLGAFLAMQERGQRKAIGDLQGVQGLASMLRQQQEAQRAEEMAPLQKMLMQAQVDSAQSQVQERQLAAKKEQERAAFFTPENLTALGIMTPGRAAVAPGQGATGGMDDGALGQILGVGPTEQGAPAAGPAQLPGFDIGRLIHEGVSRNVLKPEVMIDLQTKMADRKEAREQRMQELEIRMNDARTTAQEKMLFQRELALMQDATRREMAAFAAASRPPRQDPLVQVEMDDPSRPGQKILRYVPQSQAAGMSPPTKATADKPLTEFQGKAMLYGTRSAQADKVLRELEDKISTTGLAVKQAMQDTPLIGGMLGAGANALLSDNQQRVEQAQRDFVNAVLRQESGAVISDAEFANAKKQYFPQPNDSKAVKDQKRKNREIAINGFRRMAGPAGIEVDEMRNAPLLPGSGQASDPRIDELVRKHGG